ncbi:uncharacterized protein LOC132800212 isoform X2 [Ziziphus jujuba]|uniref:Uncharacterized protein LOC132800212 isoform X2 n=1 Tax=Ziziphus jujuba TaxID=326968 RepID=A0ABM3ZXY6_ZIZJJ|nr:uncharacterized protein LOC132800212 isoform X2 [Ziziphus jujuba]
MEIDIMSKCAGTAFPSKVSYMEDEDEDANAGLSLVVTTIQKGNEIMGIDSVLGVDSHPSTTALVDLLPIQMCEHGVNPLLADDAVQIEGANIKKAHMELVSIAQTPHILENEDASPWLTQKHKVKLPMKEESRRLAIYRSDKVISKPSFEQWASLFNPVCLIKVHYLGRMRWLHV